MAGITVPVLNQESLAGAANLLRLQLPFALTAGTGVNSASFVGPVKPRLLIEGGTGSALTTITQAAVDDLLGAGQVVVATAFGTTAMVDNDTYAFVVDCGGQVESVYAVQAVVNIAGTVGVSVGVGTKTSLANSVFTLTQVYVTPAGQLAGRITYTNISAAATAGHLILDIAVKLK